MWLSQRRQTELEEAAAELGQVTVPGSPAGVALAGERRDVALCLPGGYHWTPKRGDTVLVVKGGAEGAPCIVGTPAGQKVPAGEVFLSVKNGVGVRLTADGRICLMAESSPGDDGACGYRHDPDLFESQREPCEKCICESPSQRMKKDESGRR